MRLRFPPASSAKLTCFRGTNIAKYLSIGLLNTLSENMKNGLCSFTRRRKRDVFALG